MDIAPKRRYTRIKLQDVITQKINTLTIIAANTEIGVAETVIVLKLSADHCYLIMLFHPHCFPVFLHSQKSRKVELELNLKIWSYFLTI